MVTTQAFIRGLQSGYHDVHYALRVRGRGVEKLRERMRRKRDLTRFLLGIQDPFEGIQESSIFTHAAKVYEQVMKIPRADTVWIGILSNEDPPLPSHFQHRPSEKHKKIKGFTSKVLNRQQTEEDTTWICEEISFDQLEALILGLSEYLCDDFGLKSMDKHNRDPILYPADSHPRISWHPEETHLELAIGDVVYQKRLTSVMIRQLREIGDFILQNGKDVVLLNPPLPQYALDDNGFSVFRAQSKAWRWVLILSILISGCYLGFFRRAETERAVSKISETVKTRVVEVVQRKMP